MTAKRGLQIFIILFLMCGILFGESRFVGKAHAVTPGDDFLKHKLGLFIHWSTLGDGVINPIAFSDGTSSMTVGQFADSVQVQRIADQVADFGFDYVAITDFHGAGTVLHPSAVIDSWRGPGFTSTRDVIGELTAALKTHGIAVMLFTHPLDGHDFSAAQQQLLGWNDPTNDYQTWNNFINDVYGELATTYCSDIAGIGFDSELGLSGDSRWTGKLDMPRLRQTVQSACPGLWLGSLPGASDLTDYGMKEIWRPSWHDPWNSRSETEYNIEDWPVYRRAPSIVTGYHWVTLTKQTMDNFGSAAAWTVNEGNWTVQNDEFAGDGGNAVFNGQTRSDAVYEYDFRITDNKGDPANWAGLNFRKTQAGDAFTDSGYLVYFRSSGQINAYKPSTGDLQSVDTGLDFSQKTHVKVYASGDHIQVYLNNETSPRLSVHDSSFAAGYAGLVSTGAAVRFDNWYVRNLWRDTFDADLNAWSVHGGDWSVKSGEMKGDEGYVSATGKTWSDAVYQFKIRMKHRKEASSKWSGFQFRQASQADSYLASGYLLKFAANGELELSRPEAGTLKSVSSGVDFSNTTSVKIIADGGSIRVYLNDSQAPVLEVEDTVYSSGYAGFALPGNLTFFDDFSVGDTANGEVRITAEQMYRYTVLQAAAATEGPGVAWAISPFTDGTWEKNMRAELTKWRDYINPVRVSLSNVYPSTSYVTREGTKLSTLSGGIAATKSTDDLTEYIHVLNPPAGNIVHLPVPADGKSFTSAQMLSNGHAVSMTQDASGVTLTMDASDSWQPLNTVIKLTVDASSVPARSLAFHKPVSTSSSEEILVPGFYLGDYGRIRLTDGVRESFDRSESWSSGNYGWSSKSQLHTDHTEWVEVDLQNEQSVDKVVLVPNNSQLPEGTGYPLDYIIETSTDRVNWSTVETVSDSVMAVGAQLHTFTARNARYIKVTGTKLRPNAGEFRMKLAEIEVYGPSQSVSVGAPRFSWGGLAWDNIEYGLQARGTGTAGGIHWSESGGRLKVSGTANTDYWGGRTARSEQIFSASAAEPFTVEVNRTSQTQTGTGSRSGLWLWVSDTQYVYVSEDSETSGKFVFNADGDQNEGSVLVTGKSDGSHMVRLSHDGDSVHILIDGTEYADVPVSWSSNMHVMMSGMARQSGDTVNAEFEDLFISNPLSDDFNDNSLNTAKWETVENGLQAQGPGSAANISVAETSQQLQVSGTANANYWGGKVVRSKQAWNATAGRPLTVEVTRIDQAQTGTGSRSGVWLWINDSQKLIVTQDSETSGRFVYNLDEDRGNGTLLVSGLSYGSHDIKLVHDGDSVHISIDGTEYADVPVSWNSGMKLQLGVMVRQSGDTVDARFDDLSVTQ